VALFWLVVSPALPRVHPLSKYQAAPAHSITEGPPAPQRYRTDKAYRGCCGGGTRLVPFEGLDAYQCFAGDIAYLYEPKKSEIDRILREDITDPVGPEFMAPPPRREVAFLRAAQ
jgi:hypothetical protein